MALDGQLSSTSPGCYVNKMLCSLCPLPSLRTSVDLLRTVWPVDEHSNIPTRTMASVTVLHGLTLHTVTCTHLHAQDKHMHPLTAPSPDPLHDVVLYMCCFKSLLMCVLLTPAEVFYLTLLKCVISSYLTLFYYFS
ncbi:hypothetical protein ATANTOWER_028353 [Ataeniobius toweri]|uniref:Uncharacterized protein n=1 Tax=Ataeniobius toweri TaxID=208326 RepID=A0ABU7ARD2_9TELE|nr:hypothetical protein [Ataeniobius toweri]